MERSIKYKRINGFFTESQINEELDKIIKDGFELHTYLEGRLNDGNFEITMIVQKRQNDIL
jgi:hypothetical protein